MYVPTIIAAFLLAAAPASASTSSLDLHATNGSNGLQAQMQLTIRNGLHATAAWNAAGVTAHVIVFVGPTTMTFDKAPGQPVQINMGGLGIKPAIRHAADPVADRLIASTGPFAAPPDAGFLDGLASFGTAVVNEIAQWFRAVLPFLLVGLLIMLVVPSVGGEVRAAAIRRPWERLGLGVVALIAMPTAAIGLLIAGAFLGIWWLGILMLAICGVALAAGYSFAGMVLGRALFDRLGWSKAHLFWALLGGLALLSLLTLIPYAGDFVGLLFATYGLGALVLAPRTAPTETAPSPVFARLHVPGLSPRNRAALAAAGDREQQPAQAGTGTSAARSSTNGIR